MLFNTTLYLVFLPVVAVLFYALPLWWRRVMLVLASYVFYMVWSVPFASLLVFSTVIDYTAARVIDVSHSTATKRFALLTSMGANLGVLAIFKYADFFSNSSFALLGVRPWPELNLILPLGISFYTFQTMSYTIDVFRRHMKARKSFVDVALYVSFFPQLVAGPIIRAETLIPQLREQSRANWQLIRAGIALVIWGLVKKVFFADSMAPIVNEAYGHPEAMSGGALLNASYAFAIQIYCDFSGYSDIAIGSALILGIRLPENFRQPYLSCSIREFWRRWHISLSTWLRDYLYIPLGGSKLGPTRTQINVMITMLLGGLWHGAGWNWVVWGGLQGVMIIVERAIGLSETPPRKKLSVIVRWFVTFHLVCLSWVFFRANNMGDALEILSRIVKQSEGVSFVNGRALVIVALLVFVELTHLRKYFVAVFQSRPQLSFWTACFAFVLFVLAFRGTQSPEFIYFQF
jgi:D-alanyl-lipoteichoic acid acyltransferase DltB (MBOAT superfamily)